MPAHEITNPSYFRNAKNVTGSTIAARRFLAPGTNEGEMQLPAAVTTVGEGVTLEPIADQETRSVQVEGRAIVECSAAIAANALVQSGTDGRAATAVTGSAIRGRAINATTTAGDPVTVELWKGRFIAP